MNKNKLNENILNKVNILNSKLNEKYFIFCKNYEKTKKILDFNKFFYKNYRFANCFLVDADFDDLNFLSDQEEISYINSNDIVSTYGTEQKLIDIEKLTENKYLGQGQTICFIDTGIQPHFDFIFPKNRIIKFVDFINNSNSPYDDNGHGTFVSGIACGNGIFSKTNMGYAPKSNIISLKALSKNGNADSNIILDAMEWVYQNHKNFNIGVVCMSFGAESNKFDALSMGAEALWKSGITVVAAAGNSGPNFNTIKSPGNNPYVITVGALDISQMNVANFSSRGPTIYGHKPDLIAPAVNITSCNNFGVPYTNMSGTSVATPIVAGICADIKSKYPNITNNEIKKFLTSHCTKITGNLDIEGAGYLNF